MYSQKLIGSYTYIGMGYHTRLGKGHQSFNSAFPLLADCVPSFRRRRSRRLNTHQIKQLQDGEAIYNALADSADPHSIQVWSNKVLLFQEASKITTHSIVLIHMYITHFRVGNFEPRAAGLFRELQTEHDISKTVRAPAEDQGSHTR